MQILMQRGLGSVSAGPPRGRPRSVGGCVEGFAAEVYESTAEAWTVLAAVYLAALLAGSWRLSAREFVLSE